MATRQLELCEEKEKRKKRKRKRNDEEEGHCLHLCFIVN
jgi:hypothetical protein